MHIACVPALKYLRANQIQLHNMTIEHVSTRVLSRYLFACAAVCLPLKLIFPTTSDHQAFVRNMGIILSRILADEYPYFATIFRDVVTCHIDHLYSKEMAISSQLRVVKCYALTDV